MTETEMLIDLVAGKNGWTLHRKQDRVLNSRSIEYRKPGKDGTCPSIWIRLREDGSVFQAATRKTYLSPDLDTVLDHLRGNG